MARGGLKIKVVGQGQGHGLGRSVLDRRQFVMDIKHLHVLLIPHKEWVSRSPTMH